MGGKTSSYSPPKPDATSAVTMQLLGNQGTAGTAALKDYNQLLLTGAQIPLQPFTPNLFGGAGAGEQANMISSVDAYKNKQLEQQQNPNAAAAREALSQAAQQDISPDFWNKQMAQYAKTTGLQNQLASGLGDSTVARSGLYDQATAQGQAFRNANLGQAQQLIGNAPTGGYIDPSSALSAQSAAQAQNAQARGNLIGGVLQGAQANQQSTTDWINQMMGSTSGAINANNQNWQNYAQMNMNQSAQNAASQNAQTGSMLQTGGEVAGMAAMAVAI